MPVFAARAASLQTPSSALTPAGAEGRRSSFPGRSLCFDNRWPSGVSRPDPAPGSSTSLPVLPCLGLLNAEYLFPPCSLQTPSSASSSNPFEAFVTGAMSIYCLFTERSCRAAGQPQTPAPRREIFILAEIQRAQGSPKPSCPTPRGCLISVQVVAAHRARAGSFQQFFFSQFPIFLV